MIDVISNLHMPSHFEILQTLISLEDDLNLIKLSKKHSQTYLCQTYLKNQEKENQEMMMSQLLRQN